MVCKPGSVPCPAHDINARNKSDGWSFIWECCYQHPHAIYPNDTPEEGLPSCED